MAKTFKPTDEQVRAMDLAGRGDSLKVSAFAGAGKTSTLASISKALGYKRGMYLAFNKAIATEAKGKLSKNCSARTFHSLAFREFGVQFNGGQLSQRLTSRHVVDRLCVQSASFRGDALSAQMIANAAMMTVSAFCRTTDHELSAKHFRSDLRIDTDTFQGRDLDRMFKRLVIPYAQDLWRLMKEPGDFPTTHDVYLKLYAMSKPTIPADFILFDEAQDADPLMLGILKNQNTQVIYVGDRWQQIYGWRGAVNAMQTIETDSEAHLTQSFRFGPEIAAAASEVLHYMGEHRSIRGNPDKDSRMAKVARPDAIVCRTNAVAADYFLKEIRPGRRIATTNLHRVNTFLDTVINLRDGKKARGEYALFGTEAELEEYADSDAGGDIKPMFKMLENYGDDPHWIRKTLSMAVPLTDKNIDLVITTGHQAKGLEWDKIKLPHDFKTEIKQNKEGEEVPIPEEELRLLYVSMTRGQSAVDMSAVNMDFLGEAWAPFTPEGKSQGKGFRAETGPKRGRSEDQLDDLEAAPGTQASLGL